MKIMFVLIDISTYAIYNVKAYQIKLGNIVLLTYSLCCWIFISSSVMLVLTYWNDTTALLYFIFLYAAKMKMKLKKRNFLQKKVGSCLQGSHWLVVANTVFWLVKEPLCSKKWGTSLLPLLLLLLLSTSFPDHALHRKEDRLFTHKDTHPHIRSSMA